MTSAKPLILIIEDDPSSAEALAFILRDWGAEVVHGKDGVEAMAAIGHRLAELGSIITDFNLGPGPDGVTLVKSLRASAPQVRILVLSGSFHGRASDEAEQAGFEVMQKPARADAIVAWLERT